MKKDEIIKSIERIKELSSKLLQEKEEIKEDELERYFYKFEKIRMDMYDDVRQTNLWLDFMDAEGIEIIDSQYKLVKHNYIRRLKHRYITLGTKGKEYLLENGFEVREHCRNENNIER